MATSSQSLEFQGAFKISRNSLDAICGIAETFTGTPALVSFKFDDDFSIDAQAMQTALAYGHFQTNEVVRVAVRSRNTNQNNFQTFEATFSLWIDNAKAEVSLTGTEASINAARVPLTNQIRVCNTSYFWSYRIWNTFLFFFSILILWFVFSTLLLNFASVYFSVPYKQITDQFVGTVVIIGGVISFLFLFICRKIKRRYFPVLSILIGVGEERWSERADVRRRLVWLPIAPIVLGTIAFIWNQFLQSK